MPSAFLLPSLLALSASASDVLLPTFTPRTMSDFTPAERLTEETLKALAAQGVAFVPPSEIQKRAGGVADGCADTPDCTKVLWGHFPAASVAVVGTVAYAEGQIDARVRFYAPGDESPVESLSAVVSERELPAFAARIAGTARELTELIPPPAAGVVAVAAEPASPPPRGRPAPAERPPSGGYDDLDAPAETAPARKPPRAPPADDSDEFARRNAGLPPSLWARYKQSGLSYKAWKDQALVRSGSLIIEVYGGATFGDVNRVYDARVALDQVGEGTDGYFEQIGTYQYEAFVQGSAFTTGLGVGFMPLWWLEVGVAGGVQLGRRSLSTGYEQYWTTEPDADADARARVRASDAQEYGPVPSTLGVVEPRVRFFMLPSGPVKPYASLGLMMRMYDAYNDPQLDGAVSYPKRDGGVGLGLSAGGGLAFDAPKGMMGFIEVPWTALFSPQPFNVQSGTVANIPKAEGSSGQLLAFRAGVGIRLF
jgi:hypothetical protein